MATPRECKTCGRGGVKLWRVHGEFFPPFSLYCSEHAVARFREEHPDHAEFELNEDGGHLSTWDFARPGEITYELGRCVPAVETPGGEGWWGVTTTPPDDFEKWKALPNV